MTDKRNIEPDTTTRWMTPEQRDVVYAKAREIVADPMATKVDQIEMLLELGMDPSEVASWVGDEAVETYLSL